MIVDLATRKRARAIEKAMEIQVIADERGLRDIKELARGICVDLSAPEPPSNVVALRRAA